MRSTGITAREINEATETNMGHHYTTHPTQPAIATADLFDKLRPLLPEVPERIERLVAERTGIEWTDYVKREVVGRAKGAQAESTGRYGAWGNDSGDGISEYDLTAPATSEAQRWSGWGTALKPAIEPIILARKPLVGTVANNVLAHGVGGLNIDACRVGTGEDRASGGTSGAIHVPNAYGVRGGGIERPTGGRFPANVLLDEHAAKEMDKQSGVLKSGARKAGQPRNAKSKSSYTLNNETVNSFASSEGGASRFFPVFKYQAKAPKRERPVIEREAIYGLRDDLTEEQVDYVLARLRESGVEAV